MTTTVAHQPAPTDLTPLAAALTPLLPALQALEAELNALFIERQGAIRAILVALLARQHCVLIGPPGAAKSEMIAALARMIGGAGGAGLTVFSHLLTRFTTPGRAVRAGLRPGAQERPLSAPHRRPPARGRDRILG